MSPDGTAPAGAMESAFHVSSGSPIAVCHAVTPKLRCPHCRRTNLLADVTGTRKHRVLAALTDAPGNHPRLWCDDCRREFTRAAAVAASRAPAPAGTPVTRNEVLDLVREILPLLERALPAATRLATGASGTDLLAQFRDPDTAEDAMASVAFFLRQAIGQAERVLRVK